VRSRDSRRSKQLKVMLTTPTPPCGTRSVRISPMRGAPRPILKQLVDRSDDRG
jgi:hypothetical protein